MALNESRRFGCMAEVLGFADWNDADWIDGEDIPQEYFDQEKGEENGT